MESEIIVGLFTLFGTLLGFLTNYGIERVKTKLDRQNYVSKARFDKEFIIYQELCEKAYFLLKETTKFQRIDLQINIEESLNKNNKLYSLIEDYIVTTTKYAPFIPKKIFNSFREIGECLVNRMEATVSAINEAKANNKITVSVKNDNLGEVIDKTIDELREYLSNLDVKE